MPKRHQQRPAKERVGRNNPRKSTVITTGSYKKHETYYLQAVEHDNPGKLPQEAKPPPSLDPSEGLTKQAQSEVMAEQGEKRSGSDSNARKPRKGSRLHDNEKDKRQPQPPRRHPDDFTYDLRPDNQAGENHGPAGEPQNEYALSAYDIKDLHSRLAELTHDELKSIIIMPLGSRLEQGAKYIDLLHLEQGEFVATAGMVTDEDHYYVPKKETDYVLWKRLKQMAISARRGESNMAEG